MKALRDIYWLCLIVIVTLSVSGCVTEALYEKEFSNYKDSFSAVLISSDKKNLAVVTNKYHYLFSATEKMAEVLTGPAHKNISAQVYEFSLSKGNVITGNVDLCLSPTAEESEINAVIALGFSKISKSRGYCASYKLTGTRYRAGKVFVSQTYQLNKTYDVNVKVMGNVWEKGLKIAATPITAAADGTLLIAGSPFIAIYLIALMNSDGWAH